MAAGDLTTHFLDGAADAQGVKGHREWVEELVSKREKRKAEKVCHPEPHFLLSLRKRISGGGSGWKRMLGLAGHGCPFTAAPEPTMCARQLSHQRWEKKWRAAAGKIGAGTLAGLLGSGPCSLPKPASLLY